MGNWALDNLRALLLGDPWGRLAQTLLLQGWWMVREERVGLPAYSESSRSMPQIVTSHKRDPGFREGPRWDASRHGTVWGLSQFSMLWGCLLLCYRGVGDSANRRQGDPGWQIGWGVDQVGQEETGIFKKQCRRGTSEETEAAGAEPPGRAWVRGPGGKSHLRLYSPVFPSLHTSWQTLGMMIFSCHIGTNRQVAWVGDHWGLCSPGPCQLEALWWSLATRTWGSPLNTC